MFNDPWIQGYADKVAKGEANRPPSIQDPARSYTGGILTEQNYRPTTPAKQPEEALAEQNNYDKLAPWEKWVAERLPGFAESTVGKALTWFGDTWAGKMLGYLDVAAEGIERTTGFVAQAVDAYNKPEDWQKFWKEEVGAAWYAGSLVADMTNLPDIVRDPQTGQIRMVIPTDLPGIRGIVEARKKISEGVPLTQVRDDYYNSAGALALRAQMQDLAFHVVADPLNYVLPYLKPVERIKAAGIALRTYRTSDEFIDLTQGLVKTATSKIDELGEALKVAENVVEPDVVKINKIKGEIATWENTLTSTTETLAKVKPTSTMTRRERIVYQLTGGDMLSPKAGKVEFLGKSIGVWNPFGLTPSARAHEYVNVLQNGVGNYILSRTDDPAQIAEEILHAYQGATDNLLGHFFMTPEGAAVQSSIGRINMETQELYAAWLMTREARDQVGRFAQALDTDVHEITRLMKDSPATLAKRLVDKGLPIDPKDLSKLYKEIDDVPFTKMEWKYKLMNKILDVGAEDAVIRFGVKARGSLEKAAFTLKAAETMAFLRLNPGYVVRNFFNNEFTMIARGLGGNFTAADMEKFITETLRFEPGRFGQGFSMVGEGALQQLDTKVGTTVIEDALRGDPGMWDKISRGIKDVNLGKLDMGEWAQKVEQYASRRAYMKGYMQGWRQYYWKPDVGYDTIRRYDSNLASALDDYDPKVIKAVENAIKGAYHEADVDDALRNKNLNTLTDAILDEANKRAGFNLEEVIEPEFMEKIRSGLGDAVQENRIDDFFATIRNELEAHLDEANIATKEHYMQRAATLIEAEGARGVATLVGDVMDEFWGAHETYINHMSELSMIDISDKALLNKMWEHITKRNSRYWKRQFDRLEAAAEGIRQGAKDSGLQIHDDVFTRLKEWRKLHDDFYAYRDKLRNSYFGPLREGKTPKIDYDTMLDKIDKAYLELIENESKKLWGVDTLLSEHIPVVENGIEYRKLFDAWRFKVRKLKEQDKLDMLAFRRSTKGMTRKQTDEAWKVQWAKKQERMQVIRTTERLGFRGMAGDDGAVEALYLLAQEREEAYKIARAAHDKYVAGEALTPEEDAARLQFLRDNSIDTQPGDWGFQDYVDEQLATIREQAFEPIRPINDILPDEILAAYDEYQAAAERVNQLAGAEGDALDAAKKTAEAAEAKYRKALADAGIDEMSVTDEALEATRNLSPEERAANQQILDVNKRVEERQKLAFKQEMEFHLSLIETGEKGGWGANVVEVEDIGPGAGDLGKGSVTTHVSAPDASTYPDWYKWLTDPGNKKHKGMSDQYTKVKRSTIINQLKVMAETGEVPNTKAAEQILDAMGRSGKHSIENMYGKDPVQLLGTPEGWHAVNDVLQQQGAMGFLDHPTFQYMSQEDINLFIDWYFTYDIEGELMKQAARESDDMKRWQTIAFQNYEDMLKKQQVKDLGSTLDDFTFKKIEDGADLSLSVTEDQYWLNKGHLSLDYMEEAAIAQSKKPPLIWDDLPEVARAGLENYISHVKTQMADARYASTRFAEFRRDAALLNYNRRMNYNTYLGMLAPYEFWFTQSLAKWALHSLDRPAMLTSYLRFKEFMNTAGGPNENLPSRMKGQIRVKLPFVEQMAPWMGEQFIDPMRMALPFDTFFQLPEQWIADQRGIDGATVRIVEQKLSQGMITQEQADQALQTKQGEIWETAAAEALNDREGKDAFDFMTLMISPHAPVVWAKEYMEGTPEDIQPFTPLTRFSRAFSGLFGLQDFPYFPHNMEAKVRTMMGLPPFDKWEDYRVDRMLSNMTALNEITVEEANYAMVNREGPAFEEAVRKADMEYGLKGTIGFFGLPAQAFPEGERQMRSLADDYQKAYELKDEGALDALTNFWKLHPEWGTRLALWKTPEERLHRFVSDEVWGAYNNLPKLNRREAREVLGQEFQEKFLNKETASPESISVETMQTWVRLLQGEVGMLNGVPRSIEFAPPDIAYRAETYYNMRNTYFPNYYDLQDKYYDLPPGSPKQDFIEANPRIANYWNWRQQFLPNWADLQKQYYELPKAQRKGFLNQHPELKAFWDERRRLYPEYKDMSAAYAEVEGIGERQAFLKGEGKELDNYWDWRDDYFHRNPEVVPYISEEYELNYPSKEAEWQAEQSQPNLTWDEWRVTLTPPLADLAADHIFGGEELPDWVMDDLEEHAGNMGIDLATLFNEIGTSIQSR